MWADNVEQERERHSTPAQESGRVNNLSTYSVIYCHSVTTFTCGFQCCHSYFSNFSAQIPVIFSILQVRETKAKKQGGSRANSHRAGIKLRGWRVISETDTYTRQRSGSTESVPTFLGEQHLNLFFDHNSITLQYLRAAIYPSLSFSLHNSIKS